VVYAKPSRFNGSTFEHFNEVRSFASFAALCKRPKSASVPLCLRGETPQISRPVHSHLLRPILTKSDLLQVKFFSPTSIIHHFEDRSPVEQAKATAAGLPRRGGSSYSKRTQTPAAFPKPSAVDPQQSAAIRSDPQLKKIMSPTSDRRAPVLPSPAVPPPVPRAHLLNLERSGGNVVQSREFPTGWGAI
jgi:hypothetical protein